MIQPANLDPPPPDAEDLFIAVHLNHIHALRNILTRNFELVNEQDQNGGEIEEMNALFYFGGCLTQLFIQINLFILQRDIITTKLVSRESSFVALYTQLSRLS